LRPAKPLTTGIAWVLLVLLLGACSTRKVPPGQWNITFVRKGLVVEAPGWKLCSAEIATASRLIEAKVIPLGRSKLWVIFPWKAGEIYTVTIRTAGIGQFERSVEAPPVASPLPIAQVNLGRVPAAQAETGSFPDTCVAFSPDESLVAAGTFRGKIVVSEVLTGKVVFSYKVSEGLIKQVAFSPDSRVLYVGEQSPDGFLYAFDIKREEVLWKFRMADELGGPEGPRVRNRLEVYTWPSVSCLRVSENGDVFASGIHSWYEEDTNLISSRIYRFDGRTGRVLFRFPDDEPFSANLMWFDILPDGSKVLTAAMAQRPLEGPSPCERETVYLIDGSDGGLLASFRVPVLKEHFATVYFWKAMSLLGSGEIAAFATLDGRFFALRAGENGFSELWRKDIATPIDIGGLPVYASAGWSAHFGRTIYFTVGGSAIPYRSPRHSSKLPAPHPEANTVWAVNEKGKLLWKWKAPAKCEEVHISRDGKFLLVSLSQDYGVEERQSVGAVLFDVSNGGHKLLFQVETAGPVYTSAISPSGRFIALAEVPLFVKSLGKTFGEYRLHIIH